VPDGFDFCHLRYSCMSRVPVRVHSALGIGPCPVLARIEGTFNPTLLKKIRMAIPLWYAGIKGGVPGVACKWLISLKFFPRLQSPARRV